jgi:hypothetical protein
MIRPPLGSRPDLGRTAGRDEGQVGQRRRCALDLVAIDGRRVVHALDHAARPPARRASARPWSAWSDNQSGSQMATRSECRPTEASLDGRTEAQGGQSVEVGERNRCHRP